MHLFLSLFSELGTFCRVSKGNQSLCAVCNPELEHRGDVEG